MVSLNNTVKIHNVIQNKQFMYITCMLLQMPAKVANGLISAVTLTGGSYPCLQ